MLRNRHGPRGTDLLAFPWWKYGIERGLWVMLKFIGTIVSILAMTAGPAFAQRPVPVWNWTGYYVGGNLGYSWGEDRGPVALGGAFLVDTRINLDGVVGGIQTGYNWQVNNWVYGLEFDFQGTGQKGSDSFLCRGGLSATPGGVNGLCTRGHVGDTIHDPALPATITLNERLEWFGTVRGRVGVTTAPTFLTYITGGLAYGQVKVDTRVQGVNVFGTPGANGATFGAVDQTFGTTKTQVGFVLGGGVESVLTGNWTGRIEYLYVDLGTVSGSFATSLIAPGGGPVIAAFSSHVTDHIVRVGVSYTFH